MTIETKYNIGDKVWLRVAGECYQLKVVVIRIVCNKNFWSTYYIVSEDGESLDYTFDESILFPTKEELLKQGRK